MRLDQELVDELKAMANAAWEADDGEGYQFSIKSTSGKADVRAYSRLLLLLHPSVVLNLIDDAYPTDTASVSGDSSK
jgi:hypothetical protein